MSDNLKSSLESEVKIEIAEKRMKAFLQIKESAGDDITLEDLFGLISQKGIKFGINKEQVTEIAAGNKKGEQFLIAEGEYPTAGENARLEFLFPTDKSHHPQIKEDGHIDFHEVGIVNSTVKDTLLVKKIPATLGKKGIDVFGSEVAAESGKDMAIQTGPGVYRDPADTNLIKSSADGVIFFDEQKNYIEVQKLFQVKGSVNFSTGNLNVKSSVEVQGDVSPGFSIKTPYNIQINGMVEQAAILCDGTLNVRKGIVGDGKQAISAGGDIHAGYINNQTIKCKGNLYVANELRNSYVECGGEVVILKNSGVILGGRIIATKKIVAGVIGNVYGVATEIEAGVNLEFKEAYDAKKADISAQLKMMENLKRKMPVEEEETEGKNEKKKRLSFEDECTDCGERLDRLRKDLKEIEKNYFNVEDPIVSIAKTVFPGTVIKIKQAVYEVKEEMSHVIFKLVDDEICFTSSK